MGWDCGPRIGSHRYCTTTEDRTQYKRFYDEEQRDSFRLSQVGIDMLHPTPAETQPTPASELARLLLLARSVPGSDGKYRGAGAWSVDGVLQTGGWGLSVETDTHSTPLQFLFCGASYGGACGRGGGRV
jgi:hypothetical protein